VTSTSPLPYESAFTSFRLVLPSSLVSWARPVSNRHAPDTIQPNRLRSHWSRVALPHACLRTC